MDEPSYCEATVTNSQFNTEAVYLVSFAGALDVALS